MKTVYKVIFFLVRAMPEPACGALAKIFGYLWFHLIRVRRNVALENLRIAFRKEKPVSELRAIARRSFVNLALNVIESARLPLLTAEKAEAMIKTSGEENLRKALEAGKGVIAVTGHFGNFDLLCCAYALRGFPLTIITKALRDRALNEIWQSERARTGLRQVPIQGSARPVLRALREGGIAGFVIDQRPLPDAAIIADFFGRPVLTTPAPAVFAERTGAAVLPVFIFRRPGGGHEAVIGEDLGFIRGAASRDEDIKLNMERYNACLEAAIRSAPDHWMWVHRRWRMPPGFKPGKVVEGKD